MKHLLIALTLILVLAACGGDDNGNGGGGYEIVALCRYDANIGIWLADSGSWGNKTDVTLFIREMTETEFVKYCEATE